METLIAVILLSLLFGGIFGLIVGFVFIKVFGLNDLIRYDVSNRDKEDR